MSPASNAGEPAGRPPVRFGIAGAAHYHAAFWADAIRARPDARLIGVWDHRRARGEDAAARWGVPFFADLDALLEACDAVGVTAETIRHAGIVEAAARAGVHVLCEKPMAASLEDCDRIAAAVAASEIVFMQNYPKRFDPAHVDLVARAHRGEFGRLALVRIRHGHFHGADPAFRAQWFTDPAAAGGGTLLDEGIHAADFLRWLLGDPVCVRAAVSRAALGLEVEDTAVATFAFPSGALAEVATSWTFQAAEASVEVYGTEGAAVLGGVDLASRDFARPPHLRVYRAGAPRGRWEASGAATTFGAGTFHHGGPHHFIECLRAGRRPVCGVEEGRRAVAMVLAAYRSAASGGAERVWV